MTDLDITKHNECARLCKAILLYAKKLIEQGERECKNISEKATEYALELLSKIFKNSRKGLSTPVSVSLNNCVGGWIYTEDPKYYKYNKIEIGDIIKVRLGVYIDDDSAVIADTWVLDIDNKLSSDKFTKVLDDIQKQLFSFEIKPAPFGSIDPIGTLESDSDNDSDSDSESENEVTTNTDIRVLIESICVDNDCFPVSNTYSYQQIKDDLDAKYIICNYSGIYDEDGKRENDNDQYELVEGEIYDIDISIIPDVIETSSDFHEYTELHEKHIGSIVGFVNLKLANSRNLYNKINAKYDKEFPLYEFNSARDSIGKKEMISKGLIETTPIFFSDDKLPVYQRMFSVVVRPDRLKAKYKI